MRLAVIHTRIENYAILQLLEGDFSFANQRLFVCPAKHRSSP